MNLGLQGKAVVVMASSKGLGKAIALEFAKEGARVLISSRNEDELRASATEIREASQNKQVFFEVCDMSSKKDIEQFFMKAYQLFGTVDILINNTGGPPAGKFESFSDQDWIDAFDLTLMSYVRTIRAALPFMKLQKSGKIMNVASSSTKQAIDGLIFSNTFRSGIVGLSKSLSTELAEYNILINTIGPGRFATDRVAHLDAINAEKEGTSVEEIQRKSAASIPLGRYGDPEEFARIIVFLSSESNTYLTGQSLLVDGGMVKAL